MGAAVATAVAHGLVKAGSDRLALRAIIGITALAVMLGPALATGPPEPVIVPWLLGSIALHLVYQLVLVRSYALTDFSLAFPVARGIAPVATSLAALLLLGERLAAPAALGIAAISLGIGSLGWRSGMTVQGLVAAIATGLLTAAYTLVDAGGVRAAHSAVHFIAWFFVLEGAGILLIFAAVRRGQAFALATAHAKGGIAAGLVSVAGFGAALWALRLAPVGIVAGLRETSVAIGVVIAALCLGETVGPRKIVAATLITLGAIVIVMSQ